MEALLEIEGWKLVDKKVVGDAKISLIGGEGMVSFMWHVCEALEFEYPDDETKDHECEIRYLDDEDSLMGKCWYCMAPAPEGIHTMWMIHNMDNIKDMMDPLVASWEKNYLEERIKDIASLKKTGKYVDGTERPGG